MITFVISIVLLIAAYFTYGLIVEKIFKIDPSRRTPVKDMADGVDYVEMSKWKAYLIQFLNIAGTGPIFGAIAGAMWGSAAFIWIVLGCIFAGATHDFIIGMMSVRSKGESLPELVGDNLGGFAKNFTRIFSVVLLILVGAVFIVSPADILKEITGLPKEALVAIIIIYYMVATVLPIDKIIGKIYPIFGIALLVMAVGIFFGLIVGGYQIPELSFENVNPTGKSIFPYVCISIACGAISGFHGTQSPMIARCMQNEKEGRFVFYGAMISEGIIALIWAAAAMCFYGGVQQLAEHVGAPALVVNDVSLKLMGSVGGILAILGVVAAPISTGDTAFRSARLTVADAFKIKQKRIGKRFLIAIPLFAIGVGLTLIDFQILWRYFAWANQTLATIALWTATIYLAKKHRNYWITLIPALFMNVVIISYILIAPEGFKWIWPFENIKTIEMYGIMIACTISAITAILFFSKLKNIKAKYVEEA